MAEKALAAVIREASIRASSTRSVDKLVKALGMEGMRTLDHVGGTPLQKERAEKK